MYSQFVKASAIKGWLKRVDTGFQSLVQGKKGFAKDVTYRAFPSVTFGKIWSKIPIVNHARPGRFAKLIRKIVPYKTPKTDSYPFE